VLLSAKGGLEPVWSHDGRTLFYRQPDRVMMSASVTYGASLSFGPPKALFRIPPNLVLYNGLRDYDLHPDGRRFVFGTRGAPDPEPPRITRLHLVHSWFAELERLCPTRR
jgi:hypothetical protein